MDALLDIAGRALRAGDPLKALQGIALRDDAPALALRGIAMAQLGELGDARMLLRRAARSFETNEHSARARCATAEAEVALAARDLGGPTRPLEEAIVVFEERGDRMNALHARLLHARWMLLLGRVPEAEHAAACVDRHGAPAMLRVRACLVDAEIALRRGRFQNARLALLEADRAARAADIPALSAEVEHASHALRQPAARRIEAGTSRLVDLREVEHVLASQMLVVDACRGAVQGAGSRVMLSRRPVLLALLRTLAEAWPSGVSRDRLVQHAFGFDRVNASHRARLRVELSRLRQALEQLAGIDATKDGFVLVPLWGTNVVVLAPPIASADSALLALLADGAVWSTSALALAVGSSQRTMQRALTMLEEAGHVCAIGQGRARRWVAPPMSGWTAAMLLPVPAMNQERWENHAEVE